jgi:hypothetical protein
MKPFLFYVSFFTILLALTACNKNDNTTPTGAWSNSVFIVNEGPFQNGSGSISAFDRDSHLVTNNLFETANGRPLGNIVQSMSVYKDRGFIVVNNANKIEVVNLEDFKSDTTIANLPSPRYFVGINDQKGYVSCWGDSTVKVISLLDYSIVTSIRMENGPDKMMLAGNFMFVLNTGGYGTDSTVSVVNTDNDEAVALIKVGPRPSGIQQDANGDIWVLCSGMGYNFSPAPGDTPGKLVCLDPVSFNILREISFPDSENHPENLLIDVNGNTLYYNHPAGIFLFVIGNSTLNNQPLIIGPQMFYGIGYDKKTKMIMATDPLDYSQNGWVFRYGAPDGALIDSFMVGVIPNGFWFN